MMNDVLHANIFFLIASIATVVFCVLVSVVLYYLIKILQSIQSIIARIEAGSEVIAQDMENIRAFIASDGFFARAIQFIFSKRKRPSKRSNNREK